MNRRKLISELKVRGINCHGSTEILICRLLKAMVDEGLLQYFATDNMSDLQPEKWLLLANRAFSEAYSLENDPDMRVACMELVNEWILKNIKSRDMLKSATLRQLDDTSLTQQTELFNILLRYVAALMLCPDIEQKAVSSAGISSDVVRGSMFMFNMMTGFAQIPNHLTEEFVNNAEQERTKKTKRLDKRKNVKVETKSSESAEVKLGTDVCVDLSHGDLICAKVSRLETATKKA